ncbi:MAG: cytochrome P450 [Acidobacteriaceae bacterium]
MKEKLNEVASTHYPPGPGYRNRLRNPGLLRLSTHDFLQQNARTYGDLVHFRAFGRHVFQFNHPDMVQEVLVRDAGMQHRGIVMQRAKFVLGEGLLTSEEPAHMRQRKLVSPAFHRQRIEVYGKTMLQFAGEMTSQWRSGGSLDIHRSMLELTLRIAGKCLFDSDVKSEVETISDSVTAFMGFLPLAFLPYPHLLLKIPFGFLGRIQKSRKKLDRLIYAMIAERRQSKVDHGDLLSMLLASQDAEGGVGAMTDRQVRDECLTLLLAGHETTANGLSFVFFLMAQHPDLQEKVFAEAEGALGNAPLASASGASEIYDRLPYTQRVVAEALRIYPPVWVTARTAAVSYSYRGLSIPAGSLLLVPQIAIHRDARWFPEPMCFNPDRFLPQASAMRPRHAYFPFGAGSRMCIGENFAWMEAVLVLASVLRNWRVAFPGPAPKELPLSAQISLRPRNGVTVSVNRR